MSVNACNGNWSSPIYAACQDLQNVETLLHQAGSASQFYDAGSVYESKHSATKPDDLRVIEYTKKVKPNRFSYPCYPGSEEEMTNEDRSALHVSKINLTDCCFLMSIIADRIPYINKPSSQCKARITQWNLYLKQLAVDITVISAYCLSTSSAKFVIANHNGQKQKTADILHKPQNELYYLLHNFQEYKEGINKEAKELLAYTQRDFSEVVYTMNSTRQLIAELSRPELVSKQSLDELNRLMGSVRKYVMRLTQFFRRPKEVESNRKKFGFAKLLTDHSRQAIVSNYKEKLARLWIDTPVVVQTEYEPYGVFLDCKSLDKQNPPPGFIPSLGDFFEYEFIDPDSLGSSSAKRRVPAKSVPFLERERELDRYMILDLCHNENCYNPEHSILIPKSQKDSHGYCGGGPHCRHKPLCPIPGRYRVP